MRGHHIHTVKHRAVGVLVSLTAVIGLVAGCGASTDTELKSAVGQLDQDLQRSVEQLDQNLQRSVEQLNQGITDSIDELKAAVSGAAQPAETGASVWEYNLGVVVYDIECATKAIEPYKSNAEVKEQLSRGFSGRYLIGILYVWSQGASPLPLEDWYTISDAYVQCGQDAFELYSTGMGDQGWEMVSYSRLGYALSDLIVEYGYEVMWKRPKASQ